MSHAWGTQFTIQPTWKRTSIFLLLFFRPVATIKMTPWIEVKSFVQFYKSPHSSCLPLQAYLTLLSSSLSSSEETLHSSSNALFHLQVFTHWSNPPPLSFHAPPLLAYLASPYPAWLGLQMLLPPGKHARVCTISNPVWGFMALEYHSSSL